MVIMPSTSLTGPVSKDNLVGKPTPAPQRGANNLTLLIYIPNPSLRSDESLPLLMLYKSTAASTFGEGEFPESVKASCGGLAARSDLRWGSGQCSNFKSLGACITSRSQDPTKIGFVRTWGWEKTLNFAIVSKLLPFDDHPHAVLHKKLVTLSAYRVQ